MTTTMAKPKSKYGINRTRRRIVQSNELKRRKRICRILNYLSHQIFYGSHFENVKLKLALAGVGPARWL